MPDVARTNIVAAGITETAPFTIGTIPKVVGNNPDVLTDSILREVTVPVRAIIVGATDPQPAATETLRTAGGFISEGAGVDSTVIGRGAVVVGGTTFGISIGVSATHNSGGNIAIGHVASATSTGTLAIGDGAAGSGNISTAVGAGAVANGGGGVGGAAAFGNAAVASGNNTTAIGQAASATGISATALGHAALASASAAVAIGSGADTNGFAAIVLCGFNVQAKAANQILIHSSGSPPTIGAGATGGNIMLSGNAANLSHDSNILIGIGLASFAANAAMIGGPGTVIATMVIGQGDTATVASPLTLRLTDRTGAGNLAGSNLTLRAGAGVGTDLTAGRILLQSPVSAGGGVTQGFADRIRVLAGGGVVVVQPDVASVTMQVVGFGGAGQASVNFSGMTNGAGAAAGTLANAPSVGNPSFWLPIQIAGATRFIPCWT